MTTHNPVTIWIDQLRAADDAAASKLWDHFVNRLYDSARKKLRPSTRRVYVEQDAAQSAFHSFCAGIAAGQFPDLNDRGSLWLLLLTITSRKVSHRHRYDHQQRRDIRRHQSDSVFANSFNGLGPGVNEARSREPTPEFAAEFVDVCGELFESLEPRLGDVESEVVAMLPPERLLL